MKQEVSFLHQIIKGFHFLSIIGKGAYGKVYKASHKKNNKKLYAIKAIDAAMIKKSGMMDLLTTEIEIMLTIKHPRLLHLENYFKARGFFFLVMDYYTEGDMSDLLKKEKRFSEERAIGYLLQILEGFSVLHQKKIMHRDFKLQNVLVKDNQAVIADFGLAKKGFDVTQTTVGTPYTRAPEITSGSFYDNKIDIWSIGVCFYQMLFGTYPFPATSEFELKKMIKEISGDNLTFPKNICVSANCKDLLKKMLQQIPSKRISWKGINEHKLFQLEKKSHLETDFEDMTSFGLKNMLLSYHERKPDYNALEFETGDENLTANIGERQKFNFDQQEAEIQKADDKDIREEEVIFRFEEFLSFEIKLINSVLQSVKRIKKMPGEILFDSIILALLLLKKLSSRFEDIIRNLSEGNDVFKIGDDWNPEFRKIARIENKITELTQKYHDYYLKFIQVLVGKGEVEVLTKKKPPVIVNEFQQIVNLQNRQKEILCDIFKNKWLVLTQDMFRISFSDNDEEIFKMLYIFLLHASPDKGLPFETFAKILDWNHYWEEIDKKDFKKEVLKKFHEVRQNGLG